MQNFHKSIRAGLSLFALLALGQTANAQLESNRGRIVPPEFVGSEWLNTPDNKPVTLASRKGKVTVVEFWTFGCINCQHNLPSYARWQKQFAKKGVEIIGIHTPETEEEKDIANVKKFLKERSITYPILFDGEGKNWNGWSQQFWPTVWLIDKKGLVRYRWQGELGWNGAKGEQIVARKIQELLDERVVSVNKADK